MNHNSKNKSLADGSPSSNPKKIPQTSRLGFCSLRAACSNTSRLATACILVFGSMSAQASLTLDESYQRVKRIESVFPFPTNSKTVTIGTFDAATGQFTLAPGVKRLTLSDFPPDLGHPIEHSLLDVGVNAVDVVLRFNLSNNQEVPTDLTVNDQTVHAIPGQSSILVSIGTPPDLETLCLKCN
jgi:hypothetical protein